MLFAWDAQLDIIPIIFILSSLQSKSHAGRFFNFGAAGMPEAINAPSALAAKHWHGAGHFMKSYNFLISNA